MFPPGSTRDIGGRAEAKARSFLEAKGYLFIESNWFWKGGELDLVMRAPDGCTVFIEVRSAQGMDLMLRSTIGPAKRLRLQNTILLYASKNKLRTPIRFDVVWVVAGARIEHWQNVELVANYWK